MSRDSERVRVRRAATRHAGLLGAQLTLRRGDNYYEIIYKKQKRHTFTHSSFFKFLSAPASAMMHKPASTPCAAHRPAAVPPPHAARRAPRRRQWQPILFRELALELLWSGMALLCSLSTRMSGL